MTRSGLQPKGMLRYSISIVRTATSRVRALTPEPIALVHPPKNWRHWIRIRSSQGNPTDKPPTAASARQHIPGFMLIAVLSQTKRGCLRDRAYQRGSNGLSAPGYNSSWASNWEMGAMSCLRELRFSLFDARNTVNCSRGKN